MKLGILSRDIRIYSTNRLVETAKELGHEVEVIDYLKCYILMERNLPDVHFKGRSLDHLEAVIPRIGASATYYGASVIRQFEMMKVFTTVSSQGLLRSRDKLRSLQLLSREGLGFPKTVFTHYSTQTEDILNSVGGPPVIIKLLEGTQGLGVVLAETRQAATSVIEAFNGLKARVIVQEFIKEAKGADLRVFVLNGKIVGAMKRQGKEGEFRSNIHRGGSAKVVKLTKDEKKAAITAAKVMGLEVAGVDMLQSNRGPLILEVNSSPGLEGIEKATGKDIAKNIIEFIEQKVEKGTHKKKKTNG